MEAHAVDVNRDGFMDLAIACVDSKLVILMGDGSGNLEAAQQVPLPGPPANFVTSDFNGDGAPDLAFSLSSPGQLSVLLNDGSGRFGASTQYPVGSSPRLSAGDLNGDGAVDLMSSESGVKALSIRLGDGTGQFGNAYAIPTGSAEPRTHVVADLDEDGDLDIAATRLNLNDILILTNDGLGNFSQTGNFASGTGASLRVAADLNGDGHIDLAGVSTDHVVIVLGVGGGQFAAPLLKLAGSSPKWLVAADLNDDGRTDLAVGARDRVTSLLQTATGDLQSGQTVTRSLSYFLASADFDLNGQMDLVAASDSSFAVYLAEAPGYLLDAPHGAAGPRPESLLSADFNGDGHLDVVVSNPLAGTLTVLLGTGNGEFMMAAPVIVPYSGPPGGTKQAIAAATRDFNEDGRPDLVVREYFAYAIYLGDGRGGFVRGQQISGGPPLIADFTEDGHDDLAVNCTIGGAPGTCLMSGNGQGDFGPLQPYLQGFFPSAAADLNGDSHLDLVSWFSRPTDPLFANEFVYVLLGDGQGTFVRMAPDYEVGDGVHQIAIGDVDGDGHIDIAARSSGSSSAEPNLIFLLFGDGTGAFSVTHLETGRQSAGSLTLVDLDLDGDIELAGSAGSDPVVFTSDGPRSFGIVQRYACAMTVGSMVVGDFDEDGRPDLLTSEYETDRFCFIANRTPLASVTRACTDGQDNDGDSWIDFPADAGCSDPWDGLEIDRLSVRFAEDRLQWNRWRPDLRFDVVRGGLLSLQVSRGDFSTATLTCGADDADAPYLIDVALPTMGDGFWFLVRPVTSGGIGSYDGDEPGRQGLRDAEINSSALACP